MEKLPAGCTFRSLRAEEKASQIFENKKQKVEEKLYSEIERKYEKKSNQTG